MPIFLRLVIALIAVANLWAEDVVIVNPALVPGELDENALHDIYLGKQPVWSNGTHVAVGVLKQGASHERLLARLGKSSQQFLVSWKRLVFTGKATMPEMLDTEEALVAYVARTPGAIGYVDKSKATEAVKVIALKPAN